MTEYDLAFAFLQSFVRAAVAAAADGKPVDDVRQFRDFCDRRGVRPTAERMELARDAAEVVKEWLASAPEDAGDTHLIPDEDLLAGLELHGWRGAYLRKDVKA